MKKCALCERVLDGKVGDDNTAVFSKGENAMCGYCVKDLVHGIAVVSKSRDKFIEHVLSIIGISVKKVETVESGAEESNTPH